MPVPDYQTVMLPLLRRLAEADHPVAVRSFADSIADEFRLTEEEKLERIPSGQENLLANRLQWAKTYMAKAGLLQAPRRGYVEISERGKSLLSTSPERIDNDTLRRYPEFVNWLSTPKAEPSERKSRGEPKASTKSFEHMASTPREMIDGAMGILAATLKSELLLRVRQMTPTDFEGLILRLLLAMGYGNGLDEMALALGGSGDGGVDGVINQDPLGLDRVYVQAKRYKEGNGVSSPDIRNFVGALNIHRATKGVFVTASHFTPDALRAAEGSTMQVVMIDGDKLADLMMRHGVGVIVRSTVELKEIDEGFFSD